MPSIGDTRLGPVVISPTPLDEAVGISINLSELSVITRLEEYIDVPPVGWNAGRFLDVTSVGALSLVESPNIDQGNLTYQIGVPILVAGTTTVPINSTLNSFTEYTWKINITLTHGTLTFGSVTRNYDSIQFTFTTEVGPPNKPTNLAPVDVGTGIILLPTLSWQAG